MTLSELEQAKELGKYVIFDRLPGIERPLTLKVHTVHRETNTAILIDSTGKSFMTANPKHIKLKE